MVLTLYFEYSAAHRLAQSLDEVTEITVGMEQIDFDVGTVGPDYSRDEDN
ncbi:hypothetical protein [Achromobacter spanius]|nr:hypothetical protein [Achromobacter spanius]